VNAYELALEWMEYARTRLAKAEDELSEAEDMMAAAEKNLGEHESRPGIPLPQYRTEAG
jgi:hypothetical protein